MDRADLLFRIYRLRSDIEEERLKLKQLLNQNDNLNDHLYRVDRLFDTFLQKQNFAKTRLKAIQSVDGSDKLTGQIYHDLYNSYFGNSSNRAFDGIGQAKTEIKDLLQKTDSRIHETRGHISQMEDQLACLTNELHAMDAAEDTSK